VVFVAGLWDAPLQLRYRCQRITAICRDAPLGDSARGSAAVDDNCDWVWKLPDARRQAIMKGLMFPDSALRLRLRLRLDSVEKASGLRYGGELDAATFKPRASWKTSTVITSSTWMSSSASPGT
jgi:hypothetical protein